METLIGLRSQGGVPVTRGSGLNKKMHRHPVSPKGVLRFKISRSKYLLKMCLRLVDLNNYLDIAYILKIN